MDYSECESGWLIVENDLSTRLTRPEQLRYALQCMGRNPSDKAVERYWSQCGGSMSYDQFCFVMQREKRTTMSDLMKSFRKIDINGDGYITAKELQRMLTKRGEKMSHDEVQAIIDEADKNGDGKLDYAEFCHMLLNTSEQCVQASRQKAKRLGQQQPPPGQANSRWRGEQMKFQQQRGGSKARSSSHRGGGQERRERRREEIRSQLYPTTAEDQRGESHLLYRRHHGSGGIEKSRSGDRFHDHHQNGFLEEPMNGGIAHPASFSQGAVSSGGPFHDIPASYTEQLNKPLNHDQPLAVQNQGLEQRQSMIQPTDPASSSAVEAGTVTKTTEAKDSTTAAEVERDPAALQEKTDGVKQVKDSSVTDKKEAAQPKPHPQANLSEKPLQERNEVTEIERKDEKGEHVGPVDEEPTTKPHLPVTKTETSVEKEPISSLPSKPADLNSEAGSLASVIPSSELISDPFALPSSSSLPKLPPLKKSLPPLLPPIGGATPTTAVEDQSAKKAEQPETKLLENAALSSDREVKGDKGGSDKEEGASCSSSIRAAAAHGGSREGGSDSNAEVKVENKAADKEEGDGSSATVAGTRVSTKGGDDVESPDVGKGSPKEHVHDDAGQQSTDRKGGGKSSGDTTGSQEPTAKDNTSPKATKVNGNGSDKHSDGQQTQVESQESHQSEASPAKKKERVNDKEVKDKRQTDHLDGGSGEGGVGEGEGEKPGGRGEKEGGKAAKGERKGKTVSPPTSVVTPPPRQPRNLKAWNNITGKGCFYLDVEEGEGSSPQEVGMVIRCHQYRLSLPSPTNVWIEMGVARPGIQATDVLLFVFHTDQDDEPTELVTYTQHKVGEHWISRLDLDAGTYALIPFTSGCHLKPREEEGEEDSPVPRLKATPLIKEREGGKVALTDGCVEALKEVFQRIDLDGNGCISRMEFDFFQEMTSGESCDDDAWKVIQDNFELTGDDEITLKGFLDLHVMTAEDEEGGEGEVWDILNTMGYNKQLHLDQACPFTLEVFTEDCEGEIEIIDLLPFNPIIDPALCRLVMERGVCGEVRDGSRDLLMYTFTTPHLTTIAIENKGSKKASIQLDCSRSTNFIQSRDSSVCVLPLKPNSTAVGIHLLPDAEPYTVDCIASKILC